MDTPHSLAVAFVKAQQGLDKKPASEWSFEERNYYNKALAQYLLAHPAEFSQQDLVTAGLVKNAALSPLADESFAADLAVFGNEFANQALRVGDGVAQIGEGVLNTAKLASWLIPTVAIVAVGILLFGLNKRVNG